jgi:hypothetical protein
MKMKNFKQLYILSFALSFCLLTINVEANEFGISDQKFQEIESRVNTMSLEQLNARRSMLLNEQDSINSSGSSSARSGRLKEIAAELSAIQKALIAIAGLGAISALTDDGYNDNVPPVITVLGDNPATTELGQTYTDAGATAFDEFHGETPVSTTGTVDTNSVGSYTLTYTATDLDGNTATATRTVNVVDTTAPTITITGDNPATVELGGTYTDAGATATDASGPVDVVSSGTVDPDTVGTYTITYSATDPSGNEATASRTVNVSDTTAPVFTSSATFIIDENETEVGTVTATDITAVTFTVSGDLLQITSDGVLSFIVAPDYESQQDDMMTFNGYNTGATYDVTATVTATDANDNAATQDITVKVRDVGGIDDNPATGTGTDTNTDTGTDAGTGTDTDTDTDTSTSTSTGTGTGTGTDTSTSTSTSTGTSS